MKWRVENQNWLKRIDEDSRNHGPRKTAGDRKELPTDGGTGGKEEGEERLPSLQLDKGCSNFGEYCRVRSSVFGSGTESIRHPHPADQITDWRISQTLILLDRILRVVSKRILKMDKSCFARYLAPWASTCWECLVLEVRFSMSPADELACAHNITSTRARISIGGGVQTMDTRGRLRSAMIFSVRVGESFGSGLWWRVRTRHPIKFMIFIPSRWVSSVFVQRRSLVRAKQSRMTRRSSSSFRTYAFPKNIGNFLLRSLSLCSHPHFLMFLDPPFSCTFLPRKLFCENSAIKENREVTKRYDSLETLSKKISHFADPQSILKKKIHAQKTALGVWFRNPRVIIRYIHSIALIAKRMFANRFLISMLLRKETLGGMSRKCSRSAIFSGKTSIRLLYNEFTAQIILKYPRIVFFESRQQPDFFRYYVRVDWSVVPLLFTIDGVT